MPTLLYRPLAQQSLPPRGRANGTGWEAWLTFDLPAQAPVTGQAMSSFKPLPPYCPRQPSAACPAAASQPVSPKCAPELPPGGPVRGRADSVVCVSERPRNKALVGCGRWSLGRESTIAMLQIDDALRQLREELAHIDYLIRLLESTAQGKSQRGRPPKFLAGLQPSGPPKPAKRRAARRKSPSS